jgi:transcriptional regulator with XRE-family HTH domain
VRRRRTGARSVRAPDTMPEENGGTPLDGADQDRCLDVNAVVSYNLRSIRERRGWTQRSVAERLAAFTGHLLPQASISAMERGFDGPRRRRFDAHELYLLSVVFDVPIAYFFVPPPGTGMAQLADTHQLVSELYAALVGNERQLAPMDERLAETVVVKPEDVDAVAASALRPEAAAMTFDEHFRAWRDERLRQLGRDFENRLAEWVDLLSAFAATVEALGAKAFLEGRAAAALEANGRRSSNGAPGAGP